MITVWISQVRQELPGSMDTQALEQSDLQKFTEYLKGENHMYLGEGIYQGVALLQRRYTSLILIVDTLLTKETLSTAPLFDHTWKAEIIKDKDSFK